MGLLSNYKWGPVRWWTREAESSPDTQAARGVLRAPDTQHKEILLTGMSDFESIKRRLKCRSKLSPPVILLGIQQLALKRQQQQPALLKVNNNLTSREK